MTNVRLPWPKSPYDYMISGAVGGIVYLATDHSLLWTFVAWAPVALALSIYRSFVE